MYVYKYIYIYVYIHLSLSLYTYIYICKRYVCLYSRRPDHRNFPPHPHLLDSHGITSH